MKKVSSNLDKQIGFLPKKVKWCSKCLMSNQRPRITFDKHGICAACNNLNYINKDINWNKRNEEFSRLTVSEYSFCVLYVTEELKTSSNISSLVKLSFT